MAIRERPMTEANKCVAHSSNEKGQALNDTSWRLFVTRLFRCCHQGAIRLIYFNYFKNLGGG